MAHPFHQKVNGDTGQSFQSLLKALCEQYERDVLEAARQATLGMVNAGLKPKTPISAVSVQPKTPVMSGPSIDMDEDLDTISLPEKPKDLQTQRKSKLAFEQQAKPAELPGAIGIVPSHEEPEHVPKLQMPSEAEPTLAEEFAPSRRNSIKQAADLPETPISKFVQSSNFDKLSAGLLIINSIFIGLQVELSYNLTMPVWVTIVDYVFCVAFIGELAIRIYGWGCRNFWTSPVDRAWNIFDASIVLLSTVDTIVSIVGEMSDGNEDSGGILSNLSALRVLRVVRIVRVLRVIRVLKFFRDLRILLEAIASTIKTAAFAFLLIFIIIYMFSIALSQMVADHTTQEMRRLGTEDLNAIYDIAGGDETIVFYGSMGDTMIALFMTIAGGIDWKDAFMPLRALGGPEAALIFMLYVFLMVLCVMNVLLGIFCQAALDSAASDRENVIQAQLQDKHRFIETLKEMFEDWDENGDGKCSYHEFTKHLDDETTQALLSSLEIEGRDAVALFEMLDTDNSGGVDLQEFVTGCITMRGGSKAIHVEKIANIVQILQDKVDGLEGKVDDMSEVLHKNEKN